jgi:hypothetical protein
MLITSGTGLIFERVQWTRRVDYSPVPEELAKTIIIVYYFLLAHHICNKDKASAILLASYLY